MVDLTHNWNPPRATIHDNSEYFLTTETRPHFCFQSKREAEKGQLGGRGDNDNGQFQGNFPLQRPVIQACGRLRPLGSKDLAKAKCQKRRRATKTGAKCQKCKRTQEIGAKTKGTKLSLLHFTFTVTGWNICMCHGRHSDIWTEEVKILSYSGTNPLWIKASTQISIYWVFWRICQVL